MKLKDIMTIQEGCFKLSNSYKDAKSKMKIIVDGEEVVITDPKNQIKIITAFFNYMFHKNGEK